MASVPGAGIRPVCVDGEEMGDMQAVFQESARKGHRGLEIAVRDVRESSSWRAAKSTSRHRAQAALTWQRVALFEREHAAPRRSARQVERRSNEDTAPRRRPACHDDRDAVYLLWERALCGL